MIRSHTAVSETAAQCACLPAGGSLAEAYYGIPEALKKKALTFLPEDMMKIYQEFSGRIQIDKN